MSSSSVWTRGARCGTNNCRSRLWRVVNGQKVCQNGHIREGEIEMADDEDNFFTAGGRSMRMGGASQVGVETTGSKRLYGHDGHILVVRCLQLVVKAQIQWLIKHQNAPKELEGVARGLFGIYADSLSDEKEIKLFADSEGKKRKKEQDRPKLTVRLIDTVVVTFLSCTLLRLPIYHYDLLRWIAHYKFPYTSLFKVIPHEMLDKVGINMLSTFHAAPMISSGQLADKTASMAVYLRDYYDIQIPPTVVEPLLFKMIRDLFLPPEVYPAAIKLLRGCDITFEWTETTNYGCRPEAYCFAAIFFCAKLCYGLDDVKRHPKRTTEPSHQIVDWELWASMVRRVWIEDENFGLVENQEPLFWDTAKIKRFLKWLDVHYLQSDDGILGTDAYGHLQRILHLFPRYREDAEKDENGDELEMDHVSRLLNKGFYADIEEKEIINHPEIDVGKEYEEFEMTLKNELVQIRQDKTDDDIYQSSDEDSNSDLYPSTSSILEINQLVQSTTSSYDVHLTKYDTDNEDDWSDVDTEEGHEKKRKIKNALYKGIKVRPGQRYPYQNSDWSAGYGQLLFDAGRKMCGEGTNQFTSVLARLENQLLKLNKE